ncbi:DUF1566 domain-containing protein [Leptospira sp. WS92.C1]
MFIRNLLFCFIVLNFGCFLNPYFRGAVTPEESEGFSSELLLPFIGNPVIRGETVFFPQTGLTWMRCTLGQTFDLQSNSCGDTASGLFPYCFSPDNSCNGGVAGRTLTSGPAFDACTAYSPPGFSFIWRVPTHSELKSLVFCSNGIDLTNVSSSETCAAGGAYTPPTILTNLFPPGSTLFGIPYWTSTSALVDGSVALEINFETGATLSSASKTASGLLRCVAGGDSFSSPSFSQSADSL